MAKKKHEIPDEFYVYVCDYDEGAPILAVSNTLEGCDEGAPVAFVKVYSRGKKKVESLYVEE